MTTATDPQEQAEQTAFEQAFAQASGQDYEPPTDALAAPAGGEQAPQEPEQEPVEQPEQIEPAAREAATSGEPADAAPAEDEDPVLLDGLKRSELHRLFSNAAEVETLKRMVDKAHGNVGDLKRQLQQLQAQAPKAAGADPAAPELSADMCQFEEDYPEIAQYVRAMAVGRQASPPDPQPEHAPTVQPGVHAAQQQTPQVAYDPMAIELAVMDRLHQGWRETVGTPEFSAWLRSRELAVQQAFAGAQTADELGAVMSQYQQWSEARAAAAQANARGQQRLRAAVTPSGAAQRPQAALTEEEAMQAAFNAVMGR